eukprot:TRINITY_DN63601_c0_g1_i1.p1 TRINITY_DN63601_c0_g1~~TRINITY_DN63601_c0_g1_i1.p1  ORF type:complete len:473 (-),score=93.40 TRINITY_DN63601_c0_g1_i1:39-1457(-)
MASGAPKRRRLDTLSDAMRQQLVAASTWFDDKFIRHPPQHTTDTDVFMMLQVSRSGQETSMPVFIATQVTVDTERGFLSKTVERFVDEFSHRVDNTATVLRFASGLAIKQKPQAAPWRFATCYEWSPTEVKQQLQEVKSEGPVIKRGEIECVDLSDEDEQPSTKVMKEEFDQEAYEQEMQEVDEFFAKQARLLSEEGGAETPMLDPGEEAAAQLQARPPKKLFVRGYLRVKRIARTMSFRDLQDSLAKHFEVIDLSIPDKQDRPDARYGFATCKFTGPIQRAEYYKGRELEVKDGHGVISKVLVYEAKPRSPKEPSRLSTTDELEVHADFGSVKPDLQDDVYRRLPEIVNSFGQLVKITKLKQNQCGNLFAFLDVYLHNRTCKEFFEGRHHVIDNVTVRFRMSNYQRKAHEQVIQGFLEVHGIDYEASERFYKQSEAAQLAIIANSNLQHAENTSALLTSIMKKYQAEHEQV